jgi:hypothetical protein
VGAFKHCKQIQAIENELENFCWKRQINFENSSKTGEPRWEQVNYGENNLHINGLYISPDEEVLFQ